MRTIMQHGIGYNIVDIANQLSFTYQGLALKLQVFIASLTESMKVSDFIRTLKEKQEIWHKMMTALATSHKYYNPA